MTLDKNKEKLLDFNFYNHTINNLKLTMSPLQIEQLLQKQPIVQRKAQIFKESTIQSEKKQIKAIEIVQPPIQKKNTTKNYFNQQPPKFKFIDIANTQSNIFNKVQNHGTRSVIASQKQDQPTNKDQKFQIKGIKLKKSSKKPAVIKKKYQQEEEDYQPSQQDFNLNIQDKQLNSQDSSVLSDEPAKKPVNKYHSESQSSEQDSSKDERTIKFFPKDDDYYYDKNQADQKQMQEYKQIMKSMMMFGFGSKHLKLYLKQTKVKIDPAFFLECRPRYYKMVNNVIFKVAQSIEYFLEKDCSLKIRRITYNEFVCIKNDMLNFKTTYKKKHAKTIQKLIKIIMNMEDVTLSERKVSALHNYMLEKIYQKYKPQRQGIKVKERQLSKRMSGPPYTLRKERKLYNAFYRDNVNMFDVKWKNEIQNWFLYYYSQDTTLTYCYQKLKKLYPQYRRKLTPYNLKNYFERILRMAFGKLKAFIQKAPPQPKLPKLSPVSNSAFKKMMSYRDYQKARLILVRLYREELTESNCINLIFQINESIREFQAYQSFGLIRRQYKAIKMEGMNVISLRSRLNKNQEERDKNQQNNDQGGQKQKSITDERQESSIRREDEQNQQTQMNNQQQELNKPPNEQEQYFGKNGENELLSNNQDYFHDEED